MAFNVKQVMKAFGKYPEATFTSENFDTLEEAQHELGLIMETIKSRPIHWLIRGELLDCEEGYSTLYFDPVLLEKVAFDFYIEKTE